MTTETKSENLLADLAQFTGSESWYRHPLAKMLYTDGFRFLAETAGAYWLIDLVASHQLAIARKGDSAFQVWRLKKNGRGATIDAWTDTPDKSQLLARQVIEYTDFPLDLFEWFVIDGVMMLKSEY
jgi:hypothetical protein